MTSLAHRNVVTWQVSTHDIGTEHFIDISPQDSKTSSAAGETSEEGSGHSTVTVNTRHTSATELEKTYDVDMKTWMM